MEKNGAPDRVVIGIGNTIRSDDGVGVRALEYLRESLPPGVEYVEGGVYSLDLLVYLEGKRKAVFIDGIDAGEEPGSVFRFEPDQVKQQRGHALSLHDFGLYDLIGAARVLEQCPEQVVVIAVQVKSLKPGETLSHEVERALPEVARLVMEEVRQ